MTVVAETTTFPGSSNLAAASYDPSSMYLDITFQDGQTYRYMSVPAEIYTGLQRAGSAGSYFYRHIRERYAYEVV